MNFSATYALLAHINPALIAAAVAVLFATAAILRRRQRVSDNSSDVALSSGETERKYVEGLLRILR